MKKLLFFLSIFTFLSLFFVPASYATQGSVLGIHILAPSEVQTAEELLTTTETQDEWHYVTVPLTLNDLQKKDEWQNFFNYARDHKLIPIVRLTTRFENGAWKVPNKKNIADLISFLSVLNWPTDERHVIAFNEVNHAKEWGNSLNPAEYAEVLQFTSNWAKSEGKNYIVLPAAMDLAAPNSGVTMEAFRYLEAMRQSNPRIFDYIDYWNSHSYPNPGFSGSATEKGQKSISGFVTELSYLKEKTGHEFRTFITETGWAENALTKKNLDAYYKYAAEHVWSDPRVIAVTPFVLQGDPGPFSAFTFINRNGQQTKQYQAFQSAMKLLAEKK
jgi:hypothetical protein